MRVKYTRPAQGGFAGASATESLVEELPDTDPASGAATPVPSGAVQVDANAPLHGWQRDNATGGFPTSVGGNS